MNASRSSPFHSERKEKRQRKHTPSKKVSIQIDRVAQYIIKRLRGEANSTQIGTMLTASSYLSLLPTIWAIINKPSLNQQEADGIIHATLDHALKVSSKSACKPLIIEFVARLLLVSIYIRTCACCLLLTSLFIYKLDSEPSYQGEFKPGSDPAVKEKLDAWLLHLPQVLWEIGNNNLPATEVSTRCTLFSLQVFIVFPHR